MKPQPDVDRGGVRDIPACRSKGAPARADARPWAGGSEGKGRACCEGALVCTLNSQALCGAVLRSICISPLKRGPSGPSAAKLEFSPQIKRERLNEEELSGLLEITPPNKVSLFASAPRVIAFVASSAGRPVFFRSPDATLITRPDGKMRL